MIDFDMITNISNDSNNDVYNMCANNDEFKFDLDPNDQASSVMSSNYYTQASAKNIFKGLPSSCLSILHLNIRSLNKNFEQFRLFLDNSGISQNTVIGLSETWLSDKYINMNSLPGYDMITNNRVDKIGGGVAFFVPSQYEYVILEDMNLMNEIAETLFIEIIDRDKNYFRSCL